MHKPLLSVIIAFYNMAREVPRTLYTLSTAYQKGVDESDYEVIAIDCGSTTPMDPGMVRKFGKNFSLLRSEFSPSPVSAINKAVAGSNGDIVMICIDGARLFSPGILFHTLAAFRAYENPVVASIILHLGPKIQKFSMLEGYNQEVEDSLLNSVDWMKNGYELFRISCLGGSGRKGWFGFINESNTLSLSRSDFNKLGGMCEEFKSPGGGLANIDFYQRASLLPNQLVLLLGEGTFHQFHHGISTNANQLANPMPEFKREYEAIRHCALKPVIKKSLLIGEMPPQAFGLLALSAEMIKSNPDPE